MRILCTPSSRMAGTICSRLRRMPAHQSIISVQQRSENARWQQSETSKSRLALNTYVLTAPLRLHLIHPWDPKELAREKAEGKARHLAPLHLLAIKPSSPRAPR